MCVTLELSVRRVLVPKLYEWRGVRLWEPGVTLHIYVTVPFLPPTWPAYLIPPPSLPLVYFVKTIHHRQTNSSIVTVRHGGWKNLSAARYEIEQQCGVL